MSTEAMALGMVVSKSACAPLGPCPGQRFPPSPRPPHAVPHPDRPSVGTSLHVKLLLCRTRVDCFPLFSGNGWQSGCHFLLAEAAVQRRPFSVNTLRLHTLPVAYSLPATLWSQSVKTGRSLRHRIFACAQRGCCHLSFPRCMRWLQ